MPINRDHLRAVVPYFLQLAIEIETADAWNDDDTVTKLVAALVAHREKRHQDEIEARLIEVTGALIELLDGPPHPTARFPVHRLLSAYGIQLSDEEVDHVLSGSLRRGARERSVRERLQERLAKVVGISQSKMEKDATILPNDIEEKGLGSRWAKALLDDTPSREEILLYVCDLFGFPTEVGQQVLGTSGADTETVLRGILDAVERRRERFR
jgi:hypothetical protein